MRILIVGLGAMGSWLIQELQSQNELFLWDTDPKRRRDGLSGMMLHSPQAVRQCKPEMVIAAVDLRQTWKALDGLIPFLPEDAILADIASIKGSLIKHYTRWDRPFLSFHPLFGPLFGLGSKEKKKTILLISQSHQSGKNWLNIQFNKPAFCIRELDFATHDEAMISTLGLPILLSLLGIELLPPRPVFGSGLQAFIDHCRTVLSESTDLLSGALQLAFEANLPEKLITVLSQWQEEMNRCQEEPLFIHRLRSKAGDWA